MQKDISVSPLSRFTNLVQTPLGDLSITQSYFRLVFMLQVTLKVDFTLTKMLKIKGSLFDSMKLNRRKVVWLTQTLQAS